MISYKKKLLALTCASFGASLSQVPLAQEEGAQSLEEIVVTARFREQSVQDIPASMVAFSGEQMAEQGIQDVRDLAKLTPSLNVQDRGPGRNELSIRGIGRSVFQQDIAVSPANIGLYLDDVPINVLQGNQLDIRSFDLNRVEVLRGPQGTLFGEGAQGGAIRYFTSEPDLSEFGATIEVNAIAIDDGDSDFGYRGMVNIPIIEDSTALRLVANHYVMPGYIDNVADGDDDFNDYEADSYRAILLSNPTEALSLRLMYQHESAEQGGFATANGDPDDLSLTGASTRGSYIDDDHDIFSANISYDFESYRLESITSHFDRERERRVLDAFFTNQMTAFRQLFGLIADPSLIIPDEGPVNSTYSLDNSHYEQLSQEFRLISNYDGPFNFVAGVFYRDFDFEIDSQTESQDFVDMLPIYLGNIALDQATNPDSLFQGYVPTILANPSPNGAVLGDQLGLNAFFGSPSINTVTNEGQQIAAFFEGTYDFSERWSLIFGLRYHDEEIELESTTAGYQGLAGHAAASPPIDFPGDFPELGEVSVDVVLPKLSLQFMPSDDSLLYALYSEGVRNGNINAGGTNTIIAQQFGVNVAQEVSVFEEETVKSYEVGFKYTGLDGALVFNSAAYFNDFQDVQAFITFAGPPAFGVIDNTGDAETWGVELELAYQISDNYRIIAGGNYIDAEITELKASSDLSLLTGIVEGQPIPFIPDYSYIIGGDANWQIGGGLEIFANAAYTYTGEYTVFIDGEPGSRANPELGDFGVLDFAVGLRNDDWVVDFRVKNALDERDFNQASPTTEVIEGALGFNYLPAGVPEDFMDDWQSVLPRRYELTFRYMF